MRVRRSAGRRRGSVRLTARGVGLAVVGVLMLVAAPLLSLPALLSVSALLLGLVACAVVFVLVAPSRVHVERSFAPEVVAPGGTTTATVHVTNLSGLPAVETRWFDTVPSGLGAKAEGVLPALGGSRSRRARVRFGYPVQGLRRGRHLLGPLRVELGDPFALAVRRQTFGDAQELVVLPRRHDLRPLAPRGDDHDGASRPAPQHVGIGEEDVIARAYLPGDALKRMHWKATAHRGELMVRQEEQQVNPRAGLVLDTDAMSFGTAHEGGEWSYSADLEWAVSAVASALAHLGHAGYGLTLRTPGGAVDQVVDGVPDAGDDVLDDALVDLAVLEPATRPSVAGVAPSERTVVVVLGRPDVERASAWVHELADVPTVLSLVHASTRQQPLDVLADAGWHVVPYTAHDDVADLWPTLGVSRSRAAS